MCDILLTPGSSSSTSSWPSATCSGTPWGGRSASLATSKRTSTSPQHPFQARFSPDFYCNINWNNVPVNTPHKCLMFCCQFSSSASHGGVWNNRNNAATWARHSKQCVIHFNVLSPSHKESVHICSLSFRPASPDHGSHRGPGGDQQQGGEGRADQGLPRPPGQRQPGHLSVNTIIHWIHLKPLRTRLNSFSSRLCNININIIEPKNWIYHYEPPAAKIDAIHF